MKEILNENLKKLAGCCEKPLYVVGGFVRDYLAGLTRTESDIDLCGPVTAEKFVPVALRAGFTVSAVYQNTGTVNLKDEAGTEYEYTCFRSDKYIRGRHTPSEIFFTEDIALDAKRRDFTANAVYYDIRNERFVDPLGGVPAIREKRLTTVDRAEKVFGEDGLRLMRLARQCGQLGFTPDEECLLGATKNSSLILDISPERIFAELQLALSADKKYGVEDGHYQAVKRLEEIGVLEKLLPELTQGKHMQQRSDYHRYDILEHSLRAVRYADQSVRLAALLHDCGKPLCQVRDGNVHAHPEEGAAIAEAVLRRLKAPKRLTAQVKELVRLHMYDFDCRVKENKLRRFFVEHLALLPELLLLKQADFSACTDDMREAPTVTKWKEELAKMNAEGAPKTLKELAISGKELLDLGVPPPLVGGCLHELLLLCVCNPADNEKKRLLKLLPAARKTAEMKRRK